MPYTEIAGTILLATICLIGCWQVARQKRRQPDDVQPTLFGALLGLILPSAAALISALYLSVIPSWRDAYIWLTQSSRFLGMPLLSLAIVMLALQRHWSRPAWGRAILGLCACFELFRQADRLEEYGVLLGLFNGLLAIGAGLSCWPRKRLTLLGISTGLLLYTAELYTGVFSLVEQNTLFFYLSLSLAYAVAIQFISLIVTGSSEKYSEPL